jgi:hypothetical protein
MSAPLGRQRGALFKQKEDKKTVAPLEISGIQCKITEPAQRVIRSKNDWEILLSEMGGSDSSTVFPPIDFSRQMVVAVFMGQKPSSGYRIRIIGEEETPSPQGRTLVVKIETTSPAAGLSSATVLTHPFSLKVVPLFIGPVQFQDVN